MRITRPSISKAFSLLEVLVSVTLLTVIIAGLLSMFYQTQRAFRTAATQEDVLESARAAMELFRRELQEITPCGVVGGINLGIKPEAVLLQNIPGGTRTNVLHDLMFLSRYSDDWSAKAYQISDPELGPSTLGLGVGTLYRFSHPPTRLRDVFDMATNTWNIAQSSSPDYHRVIDGVVHFKVEPFDAQGYPFYNTNAPDHLINGPKGETLFYDRKLPAYIDVEIGILEPKAYEQFRMRYNPADPQVAVDFLATQAPKVNVFRQRFTIRNTR